MTTPIGITQDRDEIDDLLQLTLSQDRITWTSLSIFVAADLVLLGFSIGPAIQDSFRWLALITGLAMTIFSGLIQLRSNGYMSRYMNMLRNTKLPRFDVKVPGISASWIIGAIHIWLIVIWCVLIALQF